MRAEILNNNPTKLQALNMASFAKIELTAEQINRYVQYRCGIFDRNVPENATQLTTISDQKLLDLLLTPEQNSAFRLHYPNIFQTEISVRR